LWRHLHYRGPDRTRSIQVHYSEAALNIIGSIGSFSLDDPTRHTLRSATTSRGDSNEASSSCAKSNQLWSGWLEPSNPGSGGAQGCGRDYAEYGPNEVFYKELDIGFDVEMYLNGISKQVNRSGRPTTTRWLVRVQSRDASGVTCSVHLCTTAWKRSEDKWRETKRGSVYQIQSDRIGKCNKALSRYIKDQTPWESKYFTSRLMKVLGECGQFHGGGMLPKHWNFLPEGR
jgi:hypothetical protein